MEARDLSPPKSHWKLTLESPEGLKSGLSFVVRPQDWPKWMLRRLEEAMAALYRHEHQKQYGPKSSAPPADHWSMIGTPGG